MTINNMSELSYVTKIFAKKENFCIISYIDTDVHVTDEILKNKLLQVCLKIPILKQYFVENNGITIKDVEDFEIKDHYTIIEDSYENFDSYLDTIISSTFTTKSRWSCSYISDTKNKKYRIYFKIDHAYADGYKVIDITMAYLNGTYQKPTKKNTSYLHNLYYITFGTILITINIIMFLANVLISPKVQTSNKKVDYIKCKPFSLSRIKKLDKITVNDFLYAVMIKTDYLYTNIPRNIITTSPITISSKFNNILPVYIKINNNTTTLLNDVHEIFNRYKYSLYVPIFSKILNYVTNIIPLSIICDAFDYVTQRIDYVYTNIIGPSHEEIKDAHVITIPQNCEIVFNIISSDDNINLICSFKEDVIQDKKRYEECIYKAYESLLT